VFHLNQQPICISSAKDSAPIVGKVSYYGVLRDIIVLSYHTFYLAVFKCDWPSIVNGIKLDEGFTLVNLHDGQSQFERDPFILESQAKQVFYSKEDETTNWYVVMKAPPKVFQELEEYDEIQCATCAPLDASKIN